MRPLWSRRAASPHLCATPAAVRDLQLRSPGSPSSLEASWAAAPGEQGACCLLLYHLESQTLVRNISVPRGSLSYTFSDLRPGSEYVLEATTWAGDPQAKSSVRQWTGKAGAWRGPDGSRSGSGGDRPEPHGPPWPSRAGLPLSYRQGWCRRPPHGPSGPDSALPTFFQPPCPLPSCCCVPWAPVPCTPPGTTRLGPPGSSWCSQTSWAAPT